MQAKHVQVLVRRDMAEVISTTVFEHEVEIGCGAIRVVPEQCAHLWCPFLEDDARTVLPGLAPRFGCGRLLHAHGERGRFGCMQAETLGP